MLEEDSLIYSKEDRKPEKEEIRSMPFKKRVQYFWQYYVIYLASAILIAGVIAVLLFHFLKEPEKVGLYVAVYNQVWSEEGKRDLEKMLREKAGIDEDTNIYIDDSFYASQNGLDKLQVYMANKQIDMVIAGEEDYRTLAGYGFFKDLEQVAGISEMCKEKFLGAHGYLETDGISMDDHETGQGEELFYGVEFEENPWNQAGEKKKQNMVASIAAEAPNVKNAVCFLEILEKGQSKN